MTYELQFHPEAWQEWQKLDGSVKQILKKKLETRLQNPKVPKAALHTLPECYKIKSGSYRLVYRVIDEPVVVLVVAIGKRERLAAYQIASERLESDDDS